ncbi:unnamed protein product, partial [Mesorhabditis belari]|uniref:C-type lectin domain-containing protein n=1 Tax=Mesorhabditis belari TaxID=2138241 RepID=A0AAF3ECC7_9BILA
MVRTSVVFYFTRVFNFTSVFLISLSEAICPKSGISGTTPGSCYFGVNFNESFRKADKFCREFYANLASIPSEADNVKVLELGRELCDEARFIWLGGTFDGHNITWLDGSPVTFSNMVAGTEAGNLIMNLDTGKWSTAAWNELLPFICIERTPITTTVVVSTLPASTCPDCPVCETTTVHPPCHITTTTTLLPSTTYSHIDPRPTTDPPEQPTMNPGSGDPTPPTV